MVDTENREQYQTRYITGLGSSGDTGGDTIVFTNVESEGQVTSINIFGANAEDIEINGVSINNDVDIVHDDDVAGADLGTSTTKAHLYGNSVYQYGDFEDPVAEFGPRTRIEFNLGSDATGDVGVNARIDERTG